MFADWPHQIRVVAPGRSAFTADDMASLSEVPGVLGVVPEAALPIGCDGDDCRETAYVGTCAQLALVLEMTGCDDARAARIVSTGGGDNRSSWVPDVELADREDVVRYATDGGAATRRTVDLSGPPIVQDLDRQSARWVWPSWDVAFVPLAQVADLVGEPFTVETVAVGGTQVQDRVAAWAREHGDLAQPEPLDEFDRIQGLRVSVLTLCGVVVGVGLLILALTAADRATERRRSVARQVAIGVPARVLRTGQLVQTMLPTAIAALLAFGSGVLALHAFAHDIEAADLGAGSAAPPLVDAHAWAVLVTAVAVGALLVGLATVPLIRTRLTPDLLRGE